MTFVAVLPTDSIVDCECRGVCCLCRRSLAPSAEQTTAAPASSALSIDIMDTVENGTVEDRSPRLAGSMASSPAVSPAQIAHSTSPPCESPPAHFHSPPRSLPYPFFSKPPSGLPHGLLADYSSHGPLVSQLPPAPPTSSDRSPYSPPPIACSDPGVNECKLVDYRGHKVAAFIINGESMLCLPQAFELFLKHLVGGLHTVYTKLKRLDIVPLVCNVEQVRILRGLGSIQPGVNRCKLLSVKEFDILFRDCTTARPGRPPKRAPGFSMNPSPDGMMKFKHPRMDNGDFFDNGHIRDSMMDKSPLLSNGYAHPPHLNPLHYMALNHPAAAAQAAQAAALFGPAAAAGLPGLPAAGGVLSRIPEPTALVKPPHTVSQELINRSAVWENCRAAYEDVVKHLERLKDQRAEVERQNVSFDVKPRDLSVHCGSPSGPSPVLNLSKSADGSNSEGHVSNRDDEEEDDDDRLSDANEHDEKEVDDMSDSEVTGRGDLMGVIGEGGGGALRPSAVMTPPSSLAPPMVGWPAHLTAHLGSVAHMGSPALVGSAAHMGSSAHMGSAVGSSVLGSADPALSSTENLLRNIQGLLKVATDNARQQERSINYEKAELKMGMMREKEVRQGLERKLQDEQKLRLVYQRRLKKERRFRRRLQEQMGGPPQPQQLQLSAAARLHQQLENSCRTSSAEQYLPMMTDKSKDMAAMRTLSAKIEPSVSSPMSLEPRSVFYGAAPMFSPAT